MKKMIGLTALALSAYALQAQTTQIVRWVNTIGGSSTVSTVRVEDAVKAMVEDGQSNTYVIGNYTGTLIITHWGQGANGVAQSPFRTDTFVSVAGSQDIFLARYDINGTCTWATSIGGAGFDEGNAICMSNPSSPSDFYITGMFNLNMNVEGYTLNATASGYEVNDAFVIKFNTSLSGDPTHQWSTAFGGYTETCGYGIAVSGSNLYVTGYYTEYVMDASSNILLQKTHNNGTTGSFSTPTPGYLEFPLHDMFLARFTTAGVYSNALRTNGSEDEVEGNGIVVYGSDVYITGSYKGSTEFTATATTCSGHSDAFVAKYPAAFTTNVASAVASIGGPSTTYQASIGQPFYKQDAGYAICATTFGVFVTGRFMDQATFGTYGTENPSGSSNETYMFLARYPTGLTNATDVVTGTGAYSEGRAIHVATGGFSSPNHYFFVAGGAMSTASINGTQVETNGYATEETGFVARIAYTNSSNAFTAHVNNFVDGIAQNQNYMGGTSSPDCIGFAVSYRVGCGVRVGGRFSDKTAFGNRVKTSSGIHDGFLLVRENSVSVTANTYNCGGAAVTLTGTGGTSPAWTGPGGMYSATTSVTVTPTVTSTYTFAASQGGTCPSSSSPVTVYSYPSIASADAGPNQSICGTTHSVMIGTVALAGGTYSWSPSGSLNSSIIAQPTATVYGNTTYTMTFTDTCGNVTTDVVTVFYDPICPHRLAGPGAFAENTSFTVSPNPSNGQFALSFNSEAAKDVFVYDMNGRIVYTNLQNTDTYLSVDISTEAKGLYFVKVVNGEKVQTEKISNQ